MKNKLIAAFLMLTTIFSFECYPTKPAIYEWPDFESVDYKTWSHLKKVKANINEVLQEMLATETEWTQTAEDKEEYMKIVHIWEDIKTLASADDESKTAFAETDKALLDMYINGLFIELKTLEELSQICPADPTLMFVHNALYVQDNLEQDPLELAIKSIFAKHYPNSSEPIEEIMIKFFNCGDTWLVKTMLYARVFFSILIPIIDVKITELEAPLFTPLRA